ncbi:hypothetical protein M3Y97_01075900 [Aphelenchoides bicaudatus]|nr:hypothetical protein M3Y97_01075900 [Aphelenchoides bicaudatus]
MMFTKDGIASKKWIKVIARIYNLSLLLLFLFVFYKLLTNMEHTRVPKNETYECAAGCFIIILFLVLALYGDWSGRLVFMFPYLVLQFISTMTLIFLGVFFTIFTLYFFARLQFDHNRYSLINAQRNFTEGFAFLCILGTITPVNTFLGFYVPFVSLLTGYLQKIKRKNGTVGPAKV